MNETNSSKPNWFKRQLAFFSTPLVFGNIIGMIILSIVLLLMTFSLLKCYTKHQEYISVPDFVGMHVDDVRDMEDSRFKVIVYDSTYNANQRLGVVLNQDPLPNDQAKDGRNIYVTINYTTLPKETIPSGLYGLKYEEATMKLGTNLKYKIIKKVYDPMAQGVVVEVRYDGKIIESSKVENKGKVKASAQDTIGFVVTEGYNDGTTQIPDLVCLTYADALFTIRNGHRLTVGNVTFDSSVTDTLSSYVAIQYPPYTMDGTMNVGESIGLRLTGNKPGGCE